MFNSFIYLSPGTRGEGDDEEDEAKKISWRDRRIKEAKLVEEFHLTIILAFSTERVKNVNAFSHFSDRSNDAIILALHSYKAI